MIRCSLGALALMLVGAPAVRAQGTPAPTQVRLVRCATGSDVPCLVARVALDARRAGLAGSLDSATEAKSWAGGLSGIRLAGPGVAVTRRVVPPLRLLVLLDRSGSMQGEGIAYTRITLKRFIEALDSGSVQVAVAGFESKDVAREIGAARFVAPAEAARLLGGLMVPDRSANTALYSAVVEGSGRLAAELRAAPSAQGAMLLVTDGVNDVGHPRDDPGLLAGPSGLEAAAAAMVASGQNVWIMGVGEHVAAAELRTLAGDHGSATIAALDPNAMEARLAEISRELRGARELTFGVPGSPAALARASWSGIAALWNGKTPLLTQPLAWRPPLFALPAYTGVAETALPAEVRDALGAGAGSLRGLIAICLVLAGLTLWLVVPRIVWTRAIGAAPAGTPVSATSEPVSRPAAVAPAAPTGLRKDVEEAAPRRAMDVTGEFPAVSG